ncbi:MAG: hypothetical protein WBX00_27980 [Isosphaeraceae bacterium]
MAPHRFENEESPGHSIALVPVLRPDAPPVEQFLLAGHMALGRLDARLAVQLAEPLHQRVEMVEELQALHVGAYAGRHGQHLEVLETLD